MIYDNLKYANYLINNKQYEYAKMILEECNKKNNTITNQIRIDYLNNKIVEKKRNDNYSLKEKIRIKRVRDVGRKYLETGYYDKALYLYSKALKRTNDNLFNYYVGKTYFKLNDYKNAEIYLEKYILKGVYKYQMASSYLARIFIKEGLDFNAKVLLVNTQIICELDNIKYTIGNLNNQVTQKRIAKR